MNIYLDLLSEGLLDPELMVLPIMCAEVEILSDLGVCKTEGEVQDNLVFSAEEFKKECSFAKIAHS